MKAHGRAELDPARCGIVLDKLIPAAELCIAAVIQEKGLIAIFETADAVDSFGGKCSGWGLHSHGIAADCRAGQRAVGVLHPGKELRGNDRIGIDLRLARIPFPHPVQQVGVGAGWALRTRFGFRPDERKMVDRPGDDDGNIHRALIGQRGRAGGNGEGDAFGGVVYADRGEPRRLRDRADGKRREGLIPCVTPIRVTTDAAEVILPALSEGKRYSPTVWVMV